MWQGWKWSKDLFLFQKQVLGGLPEGVVCPGPAPGAHPDLDRPQVRNLLHVLLRHPRHPERPDGHLRPELDRQRGRRLHGPLPRGVLLRDGQQVDQVDLQEEEEAVPAAAPAWGGEEGWGWVPHYLHHVKHWTGAINTVTNTGKEFMFLQKKTTFDSLEGDAGLPAVLVAAYESVESPDWSAGVPGGGIVWGRGTVELRLTSCRLKRRGIYYAASSNAHLLTGPQQKPGSPWRAKSPKIGVVLKDRGERGEERTHMVEDRSKLTKIIYRTL